MRYRGVLFDLDGTLLDSVELILDSYRHTFAAHGRAALPEAHWRDGIGRPLESTFGEVCGDRAEVEAMIQTYREHNLAHHDARVRPYPGARHAVQSLAAAGCRLALVTSKRRVGALRGLRVLGLEAEFHVVVGADDCVRHKPDPEPVHVALRAMSVGADEAVFIGDSTHDLVAGRAAGVRTAAALWGPFPVADLLACEPDHAFRSFAELLSTLRSA